MVRMHPTWGALQAAGVPGLPRVGEQPAGGPASRSWLLTGTTGYTSQNVERGANRRHSPVSGAVTGDRRSPQKSTVMTSFLRGSAVVGPYTLPTGHWVQPGPSGRWSCARTAVPGRARGG